MLSLCRPRCSGPTTRQPIKVSSFRGNCIYIMVFVNLDLNVGPIRVAHKFHIIDSQTTYHLLLGRPWIHRPKAIPTTITMFKSYTRRVSMRHNPRSKGMNSLFKSDLLRRAPRGRRSDFGQASTCASTDMGGPRRMRTPIR